MLLEKRKKRETRQRTTRNIKMTPLRSYAQRRSERLSLKSSKRQTSASLPVAERAAADATAVANLPKPRTPEFIRMPDDALGSDEQLLRIATAFLSTQVLVVKGDENELVFRLVEIEFYVNTPTSFDPFAHKEIPSCGGLWYFHQQGRGY
jgi:hypothetical protein